MLEVLVFWPHSYAISIKTHLRLLWLNCTQQVCHLCGFINISGANRMWNGLLGWWNPQQWTLRFRDLVLVDMWFHWRGRSLVQTLWNLLNWKIWLHWRWQEGPTANNDQVIQLSLKIFFAEYVLKASSNLIKSVSVFMDWSGSFN